MPILILIAISIAAIAIQLALPRIAARRIEGRLTESGGSADVEVAAFPAHRLLRNRGDGLTVRGRGLTIGLGDRMVGLHALDGFDHVDVELVDLEAGPFEIAAFVLVRNDAGPYAMAAEATISGAKLVSFGAPWLNASIPGGGLIGAVAANAPLGSPRIPVTLEVELHSDAEGLRVGSGGGTVAGYPAGPIATTIAAAVARRLEIVP